MSRLLGAILAGGQARRFGSDKALAPFRGRPLVAHVIDRLDPQVAALVICGARAVPLAELPHLPDRPAGGLGPLAGLNAALHHAAAHGFDAVVTVACDTPLLPADLVATLAAAGEAACAAGTPVIGLWPAGLAARLDAHLAAGGDRSMRGWARVAGAVPVAIEVANVNTPADLAALESD